MTVDRRAVVGRHAIRLDAPDSGLVLGLGNGEFAFNADVTGLQSLTGFHQVPADMRLMRDPSRPRVTNTCTMSNWGWDAAPNPEGYRLEESMVDYASRRGPVPYPVKPHLGKLMTGEPMDRSELAGLWYVQNPHRVDLGRLGLTIDDPTALSDVDATLDLWTGVLTSRFTYLGEPVEVVTVAHGEATAVATRVTSPLLASGALRLRVAFGRPTVGFAVDNDWDALEGHASELRDAGPASAVIHRTLQTTEYDVSLAWTDGVLARAGAHRFELSTPAPSVEVAVRYAPDAAAPPSFAETLASSRRFWEGFWTSGGAVDFAGSSDPRAAELERRVVLSQYLTRVHGGGSLPPQETGFVTQSWQGKFHLEMHWWHAAHFPAWGRPELLERSLAWYESIRPLARATAERQGYAGVRWPKQVGPNGVEAPSDIGALLIWQQPHPLYYAELLHAAYADDPGRRAALVEGLAPLVADTATFMADYADEVDGVFHLGPPVIPAQEFYAAEETRDPTAELAYWWFGLEVAQRWRERQGLDREPAWDRLQGGLASPKLTDGHYAAVANESTTRTDDHPSMLMAFGFVPPTPLIDGPTMQGTLDWVLEHWQWETAWGWDFPVMAMTCARMADGDAAVGVLLREAVKNRYDAVGHNPQLGSFLPLYLPGNGGLLAAVSMMVAGWEGGPELPGIPRDGTWQVSHEGLIPWPA